MGSAHTATVPQITHSVQDGCAFVRMRLPPGGQVAVSRIFHDNIVLIAFTGATWQSRQSGRTHLEVPGNVVVRDAGQVFDARTLHVDEAGGSLCREIHLSADKLMALTDVDDARVPMIDFSDPVIAHPRIHDLLVETHKLHERGDCSLMRGSYLAALVLGLAQVTSGRQVRLSLKGCRRRHERIVDYMRSHYGRNITLEELAEIAQVNPFVLIRQFRKEYGITPHEYLRVYRVNQARSHIQQGMRLAEVAALCGFSDQSHMTRQFKRTVGVTPGQFIAAGAPGH